MTIRIAILDDDTVDRLTVRRLLARDPDLILTEEGCAAADIERIIAGADLLLLDHHLPDGDGVQVLQRLRTHNAIPVVVLTGSRDDQIAVALLKAGADDYLAKDQLTAERLCHTIRTTIQAAHDRIRSARADMALRDLAAIAETSDRDCLPAVVAAVAAAWSALGCVCLIVDEDAPPAIAAAWGAVEDLRLLILPDAQGPQRIGDVTTLALRDESGRQRGVLCVRAVSEPHPNAIAVLRVAGARAVAALERAEQRAQLERAWRLERALAATARDLLAGSGTRRDPGLALRSLREGFEADRILLLAADADGLRVTHQHLRSGVASSAWTTLSWRPRLRRWQTELTDGAIIAGSLASLPGDEAPFLTEDAPTSVALVPVLIGERLLAVLRLDAAIASHWTRDRQRALRHAAQLFQVWSCQGLRAVQQ